MKTIKTKYIKARLLLVLLLCFGTLCLYADNYVFVCTGEGAYKYHYNEKCHLLNNCRSDVIMIKESEAINGGLYIGLCKICAKKYSPISCSKTSSARIRSESTEEHNPKQTSRLKYSKRKSKKVNIGKYKNKSPKS